VTLEEFQKIHVKGGGVYGSQLERNQKEEKKVIWN